MGQQIQVILSYLNLVSFIGSTNSGHIIILKVSEDNCVLFFLIFNHYNKYIIIIIIMGIYSCRRLVPSDKIYITTLPGSLFNSWLTCLYPVLSISGRVNLSLSCSLSISGRVNLLYPVLSISGRVNLLYPVLSISGRVNLFYPCSQYLR